MVLKYHDTAMHRYIIPSLINYDSLWNSLPLSMNQVIFLSAVDKTSLALPDPLHTGAYRIEIISATLIISK